MRGEKGFVLALTTMMLVPLVVFTAFSVDLGSWYGLSARMQRAVDAASLAGVVQLPSTANATAAADAVLTANGFDPANTQLTVAYAMPAGASQQMSVTLSAPAVQYFSQLVIKGERLTRTATAVYNLHIPLGSPANVFGNNLPAGCTNVTAACAGAQPNLWAAINGPYSNHADGDPYATKCAGNATGTTSCGGANTFYDSTGYNWAIDISADDVAANKPVTVAIYDPAYGPNSNLAENSSGSSPAGLNTSYELFNASSSAAVIDYSPANSMGATASTGVAGLNKCTAGPGYKKFGPGTGAGQSVDAWYTLCTFLPTVAGIYPLKVKTSGIPGVTDAGGGYNAYSVRATSAAAATSQPQVYAIGSMSIWTPVNGSTAKFYLANIGAQYAGHTLVVDLYDPGDGSAGSTPFTMQFFAPPAGAPATLPNPPASSAVSCKYNATKSTNQFVGTPPDTSSNCTITTLAANSSTGIYNNGWLRVQITIPTAASYTCTTDCWWSVKYNFGSGSTPTDRTVWVVNVLGDPVHLTQ